MTMYPLAMSVQKILVMLSIILYTVDQASSLKCYFCEDNSTSSDPDGDCFKNPAKKEFEFTCPTISTKADSTLISALLNSSAVRGGKTSYAALGMDCMKLRKTKGNVKGIERSCMLKTISNELLELGAKQLGYSIDSLHRCDTDLCNFSGTLSVGLLCLMSSLILLFFMKLQTL